MSFFPSLPPPPPSLQAFDGGQEPQHSYDHGINADVIGDTSSPPSSSSSLSSSIVIVCIVISSAIFLSVSIYILLRLLSRRLTRTYSSADDVVLRDSNRRSSSSVAPDDVGLASLPLFTFGSVKGNLTGGDCAVCLSKFEPPDQLRLLPLCCHAFHARCIDTWLTNNQTCPLCRSTVYPTDADVLNKILSVSNENETHNNLSNSNSNSNSNGSSFRIEIGNVSRRRGVPDAPADDGGRRTYSIGDFDYIMDDGYDVPVDYTHRRVVSDITSADKESVNGFAVEAPPGESLAAEIGGGSGRNWLREYVDRLASFSLSSRALSFRSSGRFFSGSSRRSDVVVPVDDLEGNNNRVGEEISELFRWLSGV